MRLIAVAGARPHFVKIAPLVPELTRAGMEVDVVFTGSRGGGRAQPSQREMSFYGVEVPAPKWFLDLGSGTHGVTTGRAIQALELLFGRERPDAVLVVGDVNAALAAAISAAKAQLPIVHLEAGLRCGDLSNAEEINRVLISRVAAMHLTPTEEALENLEDESVEPERIHFVGNILAESVLRHLDAISKIDVAARYGLARKEYVLACLHQELNLVNARRLTGILNGLACCGLPALIPDTSGLSGAIKTHGVTVPESVEIVDAVSYTEMLSLERDAAVVVTDSSGVQVEACVLFTPCITVSPTTEQTATIDVGANRMCDATFDAVSRAVSDLLGERSSWVTPKRWDQAVSDRVVRALKRGIMPLA